MVEFLTNISDWITSHFLEFCGGISIPVILWGITRLIVGIVLLKIEEKYKGKSLSRLTAKIEYLENKFDDKTDEVKRFVSTIFKERDLNRKERLKNQYYFAEKPSTPPEVVEAEEVVDNIQQPEQNVQQSEQNEDEKLLI